MLAVLLDLRIGIRGCTSAALGDRWSRARARLRACCTVHSPLGIRPSQQGGGRAKTRGTVDIATFQTLSRHGDISAPTSGYGLVVVDECHHVPATAFEHAVRQIPPVDGSV
jgi:superfamily II DNA or RNA helicase